jgi:hypothetical protein
MAGTTIGDLKTLRARMVERRRPEAYYIGSADNDGRIAKVVTVHLAIEALDAVIAEGNDEPESSAQLHAPK